MKSFAGATIVITGASAGLGAEFARQLAHEAKQIILVARRLERLEALALELKKRNPQLEVECHRADLSRENEVDGLIDLLKGRSIDLLINNSGLGDFGLFETSDAEKLRTMIMVNMIALTRLAHALVPGMVQRRNGAVLNVSSTAGYLPLPSFAVYAATKSYVTSFSESLRIELLGTGVHVTALCPGPVSTEFGDVASRPGASRAFAPPAALEVSAEQVVRNALDGVRRNKARVVPGLAVRLLISITEFVPVWFMRPFLAAGTRKMAQQERDVLKS